MSDTNKIPGLDRLKWARCGWSKIIHDLMKIVNRVGHSKCHYWIWFQNISSPQQNVWHNGTLVNFISETVYTPTHQMWFWSDHCFRRKKNTLISAAKQTVACHMAIHPQCHSDQNSNNPNPITFMEKNWDKTSEVNSFLSSPMRTDNVTKQKKIMQQDQNNFLKIKA